MRSVLKTSILFLMVFICLAFIMFMPATYTRGINSEVRVCNIPLYAKMSGFLYRDSEYRRIARDITNGIVREEDKAMALYNWTVEHIKNDKPEDWPIIDDHILDIIIRGYGESDQMADVFTTLCSYAGIRAFWYVYYIYEPSGQGRRASIVLSFAKVGDRWLVFDVYNRKYFLNRQGRVASVDELVREPALIKENFSDFKVQGIEYLEFFKKLKPLGDKGYLRPERQMPLRRLMFEVNKALKRS